MESIRGEKGLKISYQMRTTSLLNKTKELATLCDVDASVIIFPPEEVSILRRPVTWPEESHKVKNIINRYRESEHPNRISQSSDKQKDVAQLTQFRKYYTLDDGIKICAEDQLVILLSQLDSQIKFVNEKLNIMEEIRCMMEKNGTNSWQKRPDNLNYNVQDFMQRNNSNGYPIGQQVVYIVEPLNIRLPNHFQGDHQCYTPVNSCNPFIMRNWPTAKLNCTNYGAQFRATPSNYTQHNRNNWPMHYAPTPCLCQNMMFNNVDPRMSYSALPMQPMPQPLQLSMMSSVPFQVHPLQENMPLTFQMKNNNANN